MNRIVKHSVRELTYRFYGPDFMPADEDEGTLRDTQWERRRVWRALRSAEIDQLAQQGNISADWSLMRVTERFNPKLVRNCRFGGFVRVGDMESLVLDFEGLRLPVGLYNSTLISCDIGNNAAIHRTSFLANMLIGDLVILNNIGQILTRTKAKFGNGFLWEKESETERAWLEICNEAGGRKVAAFEGMLPADAWLWAKERADAPLMDRLRTITDAQGNRNGLQYGSVGTRSVIRDTAALINVKIGTDTVIEGAGRLENLTISSDDKEGVRISEGSSLADGIVGPGCTIGQGVQARRFVLGARARLEKGARLTHTVLGDNSTVACCEVANCLIFPNHEQHHNNSFLIAATVQGQSNVAAGATIGSNHNSRASDGEILAGRGFWPGLCASFKHPSRFASYTLAAKGAYPAELNITYPFSLVSNNEHQDRLQIMPAYWFLYNMYAVMRNPLKFRERDKRLQPAQHVEFGALAPDTLEEMLAAARRIEILAARAWALRSSEPVPDEKEAARLGRELLRDRPDELGKLEILDDQAENSSRPAQLLKPVEGWAMYREMAHYYVVRTVVEFMGERGIEDLGALAGFLQCERERQWANLGGQIMAGADLRRLKERIVSGELDSWAAIHGEYDRLWDEYPQARARHAFAVLLAMAHKEAAALTGADWAGYFDRAAATQAMIAEKTLSSRAKDFENPMRRVTFDSPAEMAAVAGTIEDDPFIARVRDETAQFQERLDKIRQRNGL